MSQKSLTVIIPCKDEEAAIEAVMLRFFEARSALLQQGFFHQVKLLVVDDNSSDRSVKKLLPFVDDDVVKIIGSPKNLGYGGALKIGLQAAEGEWVAFYDMDFTYDPMDLVKMTEVIAREGEPGRMVCGDRLSRLEGMPWTRVLGNRLFVGVIKSVSGQPVKDSCTGMRLFHRDYIKAFLSLLPNNLNFTLAMTVLFLRFGVKFVEVPIRYGERIGLSKLSIFLDGPRFLLTILFYWWRYQWSPGQKSRAAVFLSADQ